MIELSRMNGTPFVLNGELIKSIEKTPDTLITLISGEKFMVLESAETVVERVMNYKKRLHQEPPIVSEQKVEP